MLLASATAGAHAQTYFPAQGDQWQRRSASELGFDPGRLAAAVDFAIANEVAWERDVRKQIEKDVAAEPYPAILGEANERGGPAGMIVRHGYIAAEWGEVNR
ncbi:MAG: hypothetical protein ACREUQ_06310, partial [Burkholderiales bacterium]